MREKGKWGNEGGRAYILGVLQVGHSFSGKSSWFLIMWEVFREATQRCSFYDLSHSSKSTPQTFIFTHSGQLLGRSGSSWGQLGHHWSLELLEFLA